MVNFDGLKPEKGFIIGEIACGHEGDSQKLKQLIDCIADSKADAVKFQIFTPPLSLPRIISLGCRLYRRRGRGLRVLFLPAIRRDSLSRFLLIHIFPMSDTKELDAVGCEERKKYAPVAGDLKCKEAT